MPQYLDLGQRNVQSPNQQTNLEVRPPIIQNYPFPLPGLAIDGFGSAGTTVVGIRTFVPGGRGLQISAEGSRSHGLVAIADGQFAPIQPPLPIAIYGYSPWGWAGFFQGNVFIGGSLQKQGGGFKIDYPGDEENRYLRHSFVESPDMLNVYCGTVTTDDDGNASVELPSYFEDLNREFCYQLTVLGQRAEAYVSQEIDGNRFSIRTDPPSVKVCWQVTGIRRDAWAERNRIVAEEEKPEGERGLFLDPSLFDHPRERGLYHELSLRQPRGDDAEAASEDK